MTLQELGLRGRGPIPYKNLAAGIVCNVYGLRHEHIRDSFADFKSLEHRLEEVAVIRNVKWVNDSKATNVNAAWYALSQMTGPVIWVAGGIDKGNDYDSLQELVKKKVKLIICLGSDNKKFHAAFRTMGVIINVTSMRDAVRLAWQSSNPGDTVLLSPACASFDLFENYEDRGMKFKQEIVKL